MNIIFALNILLASSALFAIIGLGLTFKRLTSTVRAQPEARSEESGQRHALWEPFQDKRSGAPEIAEPEFRPEMQQDTDASPGLGNGRRLDDSGTRLRSLAPFAAATAIVVVLGGLVTVESFTSQDQFTPSLPRSAVCQTLYPAILFIKPQGPSPATAKVVAACDFQSDRIYLIIEKVINVSSNTNPHPVYFVKATLPHLLTGRAHTSKFVLNEPVGTEADFYVISVTHAGLLAMGQHQVADHGILHLPAGTRQESAIEAHVKT